MTSEQIQALEVDFTALFEKHREALETLDYLWDTEREAIMAGLAECIRAERDKQDHPLVIGTLNSVIDGLHHAAFDYYVSTK